MSPSEPPEERPETARPDDVLGPGDAESLGGLDLGSLFEMAGQMQQQLADAEQQAAETEVEGVAGGGAVRIRVAGSGEFRSVTIDPAAVDPDDVELLQDLVLAALHDATRRVDELRQQSLGGLGAMGDLLGGGGLSGLGGLLGGSGPEPDAG